MAAAPDVTPLPWGSVLEMPAAPRSHDANIVRVERADEELTAAALAATVERVQAHLPHRLVEVWDEAAADRLLPGLEAAGWEPDMTLLMGYEGAPVDPPAGVE